MAGALQHSSWGQGEVRQVHLTVSQVLHGLGQWPAESSGHARCPEPVGPLGHSQEHSAHGDEGQISSRGVVLVLVGLSIAGPGVVEAQSRDRASPGARDQGLRVLGFRLGVVSAFLCHGSLDG